MVIFHCMTRPQWMHAFLCWWTLGFFFPLFYFEAFNLMRSEFLDFSTVDTWGWEILHGGDCLVHCGMFSVIPGLSPRRDASSTLPPKNTFKKPKAFQTLPNILWGPKSPHGWERTTGLEVVWLAAIMVASIYMFTSNAWGSWFSLFLPAFIWPDCWTTLPIWWE